MFYCFLVSYLMQSQCFWGMVIRCPHFNIIKYSNSKICGKKPSYVNSSKLYLVGATTWNKGCWACNLGLWRELLSSDTGNRSPECQPSVQALGQHVCLPLKCLGRFIMTPNMKILAFTSGSKERPTTEKVKRNFFGIEVVTTIDQKWFCFQGSDMCLHSSSLLLPL